MSVLKQVLLLTTDSFVGLLIIPGIRFRGVNLVPKIHTGLGWAFAMVLNIRGKTMNNANTWTNTAGHTRVNIFYTRLNELTYLYLAVKSWTPVWFASSNLHLKHVCSRSVYTVALPEQS